MKILLVNHRFFPAEGGTERWALGLGRALVKKGNEVTVLTQLEPNTTRLGVLDGIRIVRLPFQRFGKFRVPLGYWRTLKSLDYDVINVSGNRIWSADLYFPVAGVFDGPQVATPHDFYQLTMQPRSVVNRAYFGWYLPWRLRAFDEYLAQTQREKDRAIRLGIPESLITVAGTAIDIHDFQESVPRVGIRENWKITRPMIGLYVGGMWENKRVDRVIRSLAPLRDQVSLAVVGRDVPESRWNQRVLQQLADDLQVEVRFLGSPSRRDLVGMYHESDLYLFGSEYEGFGLSLLEAMASGLPFVSFDAGAAPLLSQSGAGFLAQSEEEFTQRVRELVMDEGLRHEMGERGRRASVNWDWMTISENYLGAFNRAIKLENPDSRRSAR